MPRYNPAVIEPKWQAYWEEHRTFKTPKLPSGRKFYVLDMFPYPSGEGLHMGHPEGYTATDIVCRYSRMRGLSVMHPMGWDAFGLPAEQYAKKTGTHPRTTTRSNIDRFRRQLKMLGFSYDWDRDLATTDPDYFRWTQFIFLLLYDTWFDAEQGCGRPITELPIPEEVVFDGDDAVRRYWDEHRLAYQIEAPVNWCPALGTVLANEEVVGGVSERGGHPVVRIPLRQWMLRITAYADRLERDLDTLQWPESIKLLQRNWIGRSTGAEVDFFIGIIASPDGRPLQKEYEGWLVDRKVAGYPRKPGDEVLRIYTTRPDTLFGATYMVIAPEHPFVARLTMPAQAEAVRRYCEDSARKSDLDRTDLAKEKTGVFTGSYAINPVNGEAVPIWVADYVLISYGTGAIMAVPAHDDRDFEFAQQFDMPVRAVVDPRGDVEKVRAKAKGTTEKVLTDGSGRSTIIKGFRPIEVSTESTIKRRDDILAGKEVFTGDGIAVNSGPYDGLTTPEFKERITADLAEKGLGRAAVNHKLRDWLFSRQHFWGEPFPILHELDENGAPTGMVRALRPEDLPLDLPEDMKFDATHSRPEPPLEQAPEDWLYVTLDGKRYKRETNTMPQWAGSCWYYLRFLDPRNDQALVDPAVEGAWMPVDLYVGGAEHAVLHLLYARFWHKVLYDRGYVSTPEPFQKLVNQGMILGEGTFSVYCKVTTREAVSADQPLSIVPDAFQPPLTLEEILRNTKPDAPTPYDKETEDVSQVPIDSSAVVFIAQGRYALKDRPRIIVRLSSEKMSKSRGNVVSPDEVVKDYGGDALRLYEMFMGPLEAVKPWNMQGVEGVYGFLGRVWRMIVDDRAEAVGLNPAVQPVEPTTAQNRVLHKTIKAVTDDIEKLSFNTAIARMMEFANFFLKEQPRPKEAMEKFVLLLSPFAPHLAEELWRVLGHPKTLAYEPWPAFDEELLREETVEIPVQINGKLRGRIQVPAGMDAAALEAAARRDPRIAEQLSGKAIAAVKAVPGRIVNFVVK